MYYQARYIQYGVIVYAICSQCCVDDTSGEKLGLWRSNAESKNFNISKINNKQYKFSQRLKNEVQVILV